MTLSQRADNQRRIERSGLRLSVAAGTVRAIQDPNRKLVQVMSGGGR